MARKSAALEAELLGALGHPLRLRIMQLVGDPISPKKLADALGDEASSIQLVSYHVRILRDARLLELTGTEQRRGALEHFYRASPDAAKRVRLLGTGLTKLADGLGPPPRPKRK